MEVEHSPELTTFTLGVKPRGTRPAPPVDTDQLIREAIPLAKLIGFVGVIGLIPFAIGAVKRILEGFFTLLTQFVLAVGAGLVLLYVITRALQLADE